MASDISSTCAEVMDEKEEGEISFEDVSSYEEEEPPSKPSPKSSRQSKNLSRGKENGKPKPKPSEPKPSEPTPMDLIPISSDSDMELVGIVPKDIVSKKRPRKKSKKRTSSSSVDISPRQPHKYPSRSRRREPPSRNRRRKPHRSRSPHKLIDPQVDKLLKKIKEKENLPMLKEKSNILKPHEPSEEEDLELLRQRALDTKKPSALPQPNPQEDEDEEDLELRMIALRSAILKKYKNKKRNNNNNTKKRKISRDESPFTERFLTETIQEENLGQEDMDLDTDIEKEKETIYSTNEETFDVGPIIQNQSFLPPTYCSPTPEMDLLDLPPVVDVNQPSIFVDTPLVSPNLVPNPFNNHYRLLCPIQDNSDDVCSVVSSPAGSFSPSNSLQEERRQPRQEEEDEDTLRAILLASISKKKDDQPPVEEIIPNKTDPLPVLFKATYKIIKSKNIPSVTDSQRIVINLNSDTESEEEENRNPVEDTRKVDIERSVDQFLKEVRSKHESNNADKDKVNGIDGTNTFKTVNKEKNISGTLGINVGKSNTKIIPSTLAPEGNTNTTPAAVRHLPAFRQKEYHRLKQEIIAREKLQMQKKQVSQPFDKTWKIPKKTVAEKNINEFKPCLKVLSKDELNKKCLQVQIRQNVEERTVILGDSDICDKNVTSVVNSGSEERDLGEDTNIVTLELDNLEKKLADMESKLVVERYKVVDDLSNMSSDFLKWNSGQELKRNLMSEVGKLKEQLKLAEEKLKEQCSILNEMQPRVLVAQDKLKKGQEECTKLTQLCARLGSQLIGKEYKIPEAGLTLLKNKFEEVTKSNSNQSTNNVISPLTLETEPKDNQEFSARSQPAKQNAKNPYISVLSHLKGPRRENPNGIICPFELMGTCSDTDCKFVHQSTTNRRKKT